MENTFNFDLERLKETIECPYHIMPSGMDFDEFQKWIYSLPKTANFSFVLPKADTPKIAPIER